MPSLLTGVIDHSGIRLSTWQYDAGGRIIAAQHANGVDGISLSYSSSGSSLLQAVTNALGKQTTYTFSASSPAREPLLISVVGNASAHCLGTIASLICDQNNRRSSTTDNAGNVTTYTYGSDGRAQTITEARGTAQPRIKSVTWNATFGVPTQIVEPGQTTTFTCDTAGRLLTRVQTDTTQNLVPYLTQGAHENVELHVQRTGPVEQR
ncbi:hypothetical protein [Paraburkholderia sp.]|uniref:hypothetical protein n=1 Tax=Paraburkholderia sp. TaxID=1926495 RepID=UPI003D6F2114